MATAAAAALFGVPLIPNTLMLYLCFLLKVGAAGHIVDSIFQYTIHKQRSTMDEYLTMPFCSYLIYYQIMFKIVVQPMRIHPRVDFLLISNRIFQCVNAHVQYEFGVSRIAILYMSVQ